MANEGGLIIPKVGEMTDKEILEATKASNDALEKLVAKSVKDTKRDALEKALNAKIEKLTDIEIKNSKSPIQKMRDKLTKFQDKLKKSGWAKKVLGVLNKTYKKAGSWVSKLLKFLLTMAILDPNGTFLTSLLNMAVGFISVLIGMIPKILVTMIKLIPIIANALLQAVLVLAESLSKMFGDLKKLFPEGSFMYSLLEFAEYLFSKGGPLIKIINSVKQFFKDLSDPNTSFVQAFKKLLFNIFGAVKDVFSKLAPELQMLILGLVAFKTIMFIANNVVKASNVLKKIKNAYDVVGLSLSRAKNALARFKNKLGKKEIKIEDKLVLQRARLFQDKTKELALNKKILKQEKKSLRTKIKETVINKIRLGLQKALNIASAIYNFVVSLNPITMIIIAIVGAMFLLTDAFKVIMDFGKRVANLFTQLFSGEINFGEFLLGIGDALLDLFFGLIDSIFEAFIELGFLIVDIIMWPLNKIGEFIGWIAKKWEGIKKAVADFFSDFGANMSKFIAKIPKMIGNLISKIGDWISTKFKSIFGSLFNYINAFIDSTTLIGDSEINDYNTKVVYRAYELQALRKEAKKAGIKGQVGTNLSAKEFFKEKVMTGGFGELSKSSQDTVASNIANEIKRLKKAIDDKADQDDKNAKEGNKNTKLTAEEVKKANQKETSKAISGSSDILNIADQVIGFIGG